LLKLNHGAKNHGLHAVKLIKSMQFHS